MSCVIGSTAMSCPIGSKACLVQSVQLRQKVIRRTTLVYFTIVLRVKLILVPVAFVDAAHVLFHTSPSALSSLALQAQHVPESHNNYKGSPMLGGGVCET